MKIGKLPSVRLQWVLSKQVRPIKDWSSGEIQNVREVQRQRYYLLLTLKMEAAKWPGVWVDWRAAPGQ